MSILELHQHVDNLASLSRVGNQAAINELSQHVFVRVGIPPEIASAFHLTQRLAQAETDYQKGLQPALHEADVVNTHNHLAKTLMLPEWAYTNAEELRRMRMDFVARYPQFLASHPIFDQKGRLNILSDNLSPEEAVFLSTTLLYQKMYSAEYQMTDAEHAAGGKDKIEDSVFHARTNELYSIFTDHSGAVNIFDLARAIEGYFSDLKINNSLRPEFDNPSLVPVQTTAKGGR